MRGGEYAPVTGEEIRALRKKHNLSQVQLAMLACSSVFPSPDGKRLVARRVQAWEAGTNRMPLACWELLQLKLQLLDHGATMEALLTTPAIDLATDIMNRYRSTLAQLSKN